MRCRLLGRLLVLRLRNTQCLHSLCRPEQRRLLTRHQLLQHLALAHALGLGLLQVEAVARQLAQLAVQHALPEAVALLSFEPAAGLWQ